MTTLNANEDGSLELACGCRTEVINGKSINILCDYHEQEMEDMLKTPVYFKKTKMRDSREI
jgi:hypothetical protein